MQIEFVNGVVMNVTQVSENKNVYSVPERWELKIISTTDFSSDDLDVLLCKENINKLIQTSDTGAVSVINGYNKVEKVHKITNSGGVSLTIVLEKELI